jgi:hypothetical protein
MARVKQFLRRRMSQLKQGTISAQHQVKGRLQPFPDPVLGNKIVDILIAKGKYIHQFFRAAQPTFRMLDNLHGVSLVFDDSLPTFEKL